ncbi:TetR/AcrR family transcriptional regulator [Bradyrhizobium sp. HKCCYLR20261]|uniref:TetR/AcrR family transcriptional regulator n=1 Tax=Bradyrhizobium sp. HKCCYLR20261 TaxID=3420760 RepID=UPI003EC11BFF
MTKPPAKTPSTTPPSQAQGRPYHHGDLKRALIGAATGLLEQEGAEALSFRAVARAAGVSQSAPYNHFAGKADLLATIAEAGFVALAAAQTEAAARWPAGEDRLTGLGLDYIRFAVRQPQLYRLMFGVGVNDWHAHPDVSAAKRATFAPLRQALAEFLGSTAPAAALEQAAVAAWGLAHGLAMLRIDGSLAGHDGEAGPEEGALRLFGRGLRAACAAVS